jgi:hypothetical protein
VDLDAETLTRLQATRLRDVTEEGKLEDDAEDIDRERRRRDLERKYASERREERDDDAYDRRKAELEHDKNMRQVDRERKHMQLSHDVEEWGRQEEAEQEKLKQEKLEQKKDD